ncbi:putative S-adenosylmethionine carrier 2, chloroplastic [Porphyridium purpureum]|uniref:Putative S-adenosylmethionine carrier 2, chloroplastic n=1 Tax=Porphyridium purpureum TaxID=35688 RepID=A0A5J4Z147_PORPP|nr:putative S-adenosylmethionine carrier 2, chloroplastic [Porphyridium purpureum]|eukprot:POR8161..scf208_2
MTANSAMKSSIVFVAPPATNASAANGSMVLPLPLTKSAPSIQREVRQPAQNASAKQNRHEQDQKHLLARDETPRAAQTMTSDSATSGKGSIGRRILSNALAEMSIALLLYPLETIKVRRQLSTTLCGFPQTGTRGMALKMRGLYAGVSQAVVAAVPTAAIFAMVYYAVKRVSERKLPPRFHFAAGVGSGAVANLMSSLIDTPFNLMQGRVQAGVNATVSDAFRSVLASRGVPGLFTGFKSNLLQSMPFDALEFATYDQLEGAAQRFRKRELTRWECLALGMLCGSLVGVLTSPFDVIRSRVLSNPSCSGRIRQTVATMWREGGVGAFFRGTRAKMVWEAANSGAFFFFSEEWGRVLHNRQLVAARAGTA